MAGRDGLGQFLRGVGRTKLLSAEEEIELARRVEQGDAQARQRMIESNLRLVVSMVKPYAHLGVPLADLVQEGTVGLIRAVDKFDHRRGNRFATYAVFWIRRYAARAIAEQSRLVRLPADANSRLLRIWRAQRELTAELGRAPSTEEVAGSLDLARAEVDRLLQVSAPVASLDEPFGDDGQALRDRLADRTADDPAESLGLDGRAVAALLGGLSPRQREVIVRRFGMAGREAESPEAIARALGVSRSRVLRLEREGLARVHRDLRPRRRGDLASAA